MENPIKSVLSGDRKGNYIRLIAAGHVESSALRVLDWDWLDFFEACALDPQFTKDIERARETRADKWIDGIAESLDKKYYIEERREDGSVIQHERAPTKEETARDKLHFEKRKFLAQADNPKKYGSVSGKMNVDVEVDLKNLKLLPPDEAIKVLQNDPFAKKPKIIEVETKEITDGKEE